MCCNFYFNIRNMHLTYFLSKSKCSLVGKLYKMNLKYMWKYICHNNEESIVKHIKMLKLFIKPWKFKQQCVDIKPYKNIGKRRILCQ